MDFLRFSLYSSVVLSLSPYSIAASRCISSHLSALKQESAPETPIPLPETPKRIAIIGGGLGGAVLARKFASLANEIPHPIEISIFDKGERFGGRLWSQSSQIAPEPLELGSQWLPSNSLDLQEIIEELNLTTTPTVEPASFGIWNADRKQYIYEEESWQPNWWNSISRRLRWGSSLAAANKLYNRINKLSYTEERHDGDDEKLLQDAVSDYSSEYFLSKSNITGSFVDEFIASEAQARYGQPLSKLHGLSATFALNPDAGVRIKGGNEVLIQAMIKRSGAITHPAVQVREIERNFASNTFTLRYTIPGAKKAGKFAKVTKPVPSEHIEEVFDAVIIAAPWRSANITVNPPLSKSVAPKGRPYLAQHVTHVVTTEPLSGPGHINILGSEAPFNVRRLVQRYPSLGPDGVQERFVYRYVSSEILGQSSISQFINPKHVKFVHRHKWDAGVAEQTPAGMLQTDQVELQQFGGGLFYAGAKDWAEDGVEFTFRWMNRIARGVACRRLGGSCNYSAERRKESGSGKDGRPEL